MRAALSILSLFLAIPAVADDSERLLRVDHFVPVHSTVPATPVRPPDLRPRSSGKPARRCGAGATGPHRPVRHGAGTPAEVSFDVPYQDYSWMAFLAHAGFDVFAMDTTGYGRSTRPPAMNDPCNLSPEQQRAFVPGLIAGHARQRMDSK